MKVAFPLLLLLVLSAQAGPPPACHPPQFQTSEPNGGWSSGGYYVHNNIWNTKEAGPQDLQACSPQSWQVSSTQPATSSVKSYPNAHLDIRNLEGAPLSQYRVITGEFAGQGPGVGIYNYAWDIWLNGVGWGNGTTEFMIWTENHGQTPLGERADPVTFQGRAFHPWRHVGEGVNVITLVAVEPMPSGQLDLKAMLDWALEKGWIPPKPTLHQLCYGVEICSTEGKPETFRCTGFAVKLE